MLRKIDQKIEEIKIRRAELQGQINLLSATIDAARQDLVALRTVKEQTRKAGLLIEFAADYARNQVKGRFEGIITEAIRTIFGEDYAFHVLFQTNRNQVSCEYAITSDEYQEPANPMDTRGGGVIDVLSVALRAVHMQLFGAEGPLIMDEPMKHLSSHYMAQAASFLGNLHKHLDRQIIYATHSKVLAEAADVTVEL